MWVCLFALLFFFPQYFWFNVFLSFFAFQGPSLKQFMDIFSLPEMTLLSSVIDYFINHGIEFDQVHLYKDISVSEKCQLPHNSRHIRAVSSAAPTPKGLAVTSLVWQLCCPFISNHYQGIFKAVFSEHVWALSVLQSWCFWCTLRRSA